MCLFEYVINNDLANVTNALQNGHLTDIFNKYNETPLYIAAKRGCFEITKALLFFGADPNFTHTGDDPPLHLAIENGHIKTAKLILASPKIDINKQNLHGTTALLLAVQIGMPRLVKLILVRNADPNLKNKYNMSPLIISILNENIEISRILIMFGSDVNEYYEKKNIIMYAIEKKSPNIITAILNAHDFDVNAISRDSYRYSPLMIAIQCNNAFAVGQLLENKNISIYYKNNIGNDALSCALGKNNIMNMILNHAN